MMWLDSERKCRFLMMFAVVLLVGSLFIGTAALEKGYAADKVIENSAENLSGPVGATQNTETPSNSTYYHEYSELTEAQQSEFDRLRNGETMTQLDALQDLGPVPIRIQYEDARYIIEYGFLPSFESYWLAGLSGIGILGSIFALIKGYERKVEIRLEKLYEQPEEVIEELKEDDW